MKKTFIVLAAAALSLTVTQVVAQDKTPVEETETARSPENDMKEADALKKRIAMYTEKVEANKENPKVDYEAEKARIAELKVKWEGLTGKKWSTAK